MNFRTSILDPSFVDGVRDVADAEEAADRYFSILAQAQGMKVAPRVGQSRHPRIGQGGTQNPGDCATHINPYIGGRSGDPSCDEPQQCYADVLGFNSIAGVVADGTFPLVGGFGTGTPITTASLDISSGNASSYRPRRFFYELRDSASGFAVVPGLLTSAQISGVEQLVSAGGAGGITSAVFTLTNEPLPIGWMDFQDRGQQQLRLQFGNFLDPAVTVHAFGVFWGDRV
jgi:hypothetical protein